MLISLSIVIPARNEERTIKRVAESALFMGRKVAREFELILVDDASRDATGAIIDNIYAANREVKVVHHKRRVGAGLALYSGLMKSSKDFVFYTDADDQYDLKELQQLIPLLDDFKIISGFRPQRRDSWKRKQITHLYNLLINLTFGLGLRDVNCAFKLFERQILERFPVKSRTLFVVAELLIKASDRYQIKEIAVSHYPRKQGKSRILSLRSIVTTLYDLMMLNIPKRKKKPKIITPVRLDHQPEKD